MAEGGSSSIVNSNGPKLGEDVTHLEKDSEEEDDHREPVRPHEQGPDVERDEFGLPMKIYRIQVEEEEQEENDSTDDGYQSALELDSSEQAIPVVNGRQEPTSAGDEDISNGGIPSSMVDEEPERATRSKVDPDIKNKHTRHSTPLPFTGGNVNGVETANAAGSNQEGPVQSSSSSGSPDLPRRPQSMMASISTPHESRPLAEPPTPLAHPTETTRSIEEPAAGRLASSGNSSRGAYAASRANRQSISEQMVIPEHLDAPLPLAGVSEWSHQVVVPTKRESQDMANDEVRWQSMPAFASYDLYDDDGKLIAREAAESDDEAAIYDRSGGAGKGYTKVNIDDDAQSASSMDENTKYLFKDVGVNVLDDDEGEEETRDPLSQLQTTKDLLTEQQRIAYVAVVRVAIVAMVKELEVVEGNKATEKEIRLAVEAMKMWGQKTMVRLYAHMDISSNEQVMIEQLAEHGVEPGDLTPMLMQNARVKNPAVDHDDRSESAPVSPRDAPRPLTPSPQSTSHSSSAETSDDVLPPPPYEAHDIDGFDHVQDASKLPQTENLDIDLRWTVLCDLFLLLVADSAYDARSRTLLERVGSYMDVSPLEVCKFEKRVTDALEMQEAADKENWNEDEHMDKRRKMAIRRRIMMMGIATVGGSLVIGLSAGLLAPVIGAGLAAGFTTLGVAGTSGFLAGAGGAAMITTTGLVTGGAIAVKASSRRTGPVKTFEYRPLHNNKRVNLIVTVAGWMNGKVDDVRLPYSTVDPVMGDIYSVLWEPEMLQSMGQTINILATEALTQGLQQVLGSTILVALMASLQLPIVLTKLSYLIDNPWTVSLDRANAAGLILADSLIDRNLGARPVTLVGFSLGSRVICSCLRELASRGAVGLVQNVYLFGSPVVAKKEEYLRARGVVAGRFVNGYTTNDWILGYLFRATSGGIMRVAGLGPIEDIPGLENVDVTTLVAGHMAYRTAMPRLLREVGWSVDGDEFAEIEDPDPDNHQERQREMIAEIDEARKELEKTPKKGRFGFFSKNRKLPAKKEWETYEHQETPRSNPGTSPTSDRGGEGQNVLFDIDAIRAELASEQIQIREIKSTMPPMKLDLHPPNVDVHGRMSNIVAGAQLRPTKSLDGQMAIRSKVEAALSSPSLIYNRSYSPRSTHSEDEGLGIPGASPYLEPQPRSPASVVSSRPSMSGIRVETRPDLKPSFSLPTGLSLEHNAWLDDSGRETEVTLSFE